MLDGRPRDAVSRSAKGKGFPLDSRLYAPVRIIGGSTIVTNGDQTDTIYNFMDESPWIPVFLRA